MNLHVNNDSHSEWIVIDSLTHQWITCDCIDTIIMLFKDTFGSFLGIHHPMIRINDVSQIDVSLYIHSEEGVPIVFIDGASGKIRELKEAIERARTEEDRRRLEDELSQLEHAASLLGKYVNEYDKKTDTEQPRIVLYRDAIVQSANRHGYEPLNLAIVVLVHELMHAYFDSGAKYIAETEEPLAELGCIYFFAKNAAEYPGLKQLAYKFCKSKLDYSCLCHYGYGALLYDARSGKAITDLITRYKNIVR